jgi:hypothetical protein
VSTGYLFADFIIVAIGSALVATLYYGLIVQAVVWWRPDVYREPFGDLPTLPRRDQ